MGEIFFKSTDSSSDGNSSYYSDYITHLSRNGLPVSEKFISKEEFINDLYAERWGLSNSSTRSNSVSLMPLYDLRLEFAHTSLLLKVFKFWAMTGSPSTAGTRIGAICKIISNQGEVILSDIVFLKSIYSVLTIANKKNLNHLFRALYETFKKKEYKEQRKWALNNLDPERVNPHDPVNGAYSDYQFNQIMDKSNVELEQSKEAWFKEGTDKRFLKYSRCVFSLLSLITSRRMSQFVQCKVVDIQPYSDHSSSQKVDDNLLEIRFFKAKTSKSGFRGKPEKSRFLLSQYFSKVVLIYLQDLKRHIKGICFDFEVQFDDIDWKSFPLFPSIDSIRSANDLVSPSLHSDRLHKVFRKHGSELFSIARVRHTTITRGMEAGLTNIELSRLTGVTTAATRNYKDLTPESRNLINQRFCKNELLLKSFSWTLREYKEKFERTCTDELGQELGGIKNDTGCKSCAKQLGAPLGCYTCASESFIPFLEGDHHTQLVKAQAKKYFLETMGANKHQLFEIDFIIKKIEQVIQKQKQHGHKVLK